MVEFKDLVPGDRFTLQGKIFTKITDDFAREHSRESIRLRERGFGAEETTVLFDEDVVVEYLPVRVEILW